MPQKTIKSPNTKKAKKANPSHFDKGCKPGPGRRKIVRAGSPEFVKSILEASAMKQTITLTGSVDGKLETTDFKFDLKTSDSIIAALLGKQILMAINGNLDAIKDLLNRYFSAPASQDKKSTDNMTDEEINQEIKQIARTEKHLIEFKKTGT